MFRKRTPRVRWSARLGLVARCNPLVLASIAVAGYSANIANAANFTWNNPAGGTYSVGGNWLGGNPPATTDAALFNLGPAAGYTVSFASGTSATQFRVLNDNITLDLNTNAFAITQAGSGYAVNVGESAGQIGQLTVSAGTLTATNSGIGVGTGSSGTGVVASNGAVTNSGSLTLGENGSGTLLVNGVSSATFTRIGRQVGATGTLIVDGPSALYQNTVASQFYVGIFGAGTVLLRNGATLNELGSFLSPFGGAAYASIDGDGSTWNSSDGIYVGFNGPATFTISNGGVFNHTGTAFSSGIGVQGTGSGTATVTGQDSRWILAAQLSVGNTGRGTLTISNAGTVSSAKASSDTHCYIGEGTTSIGFARVTGAGSSFTGNGAIAVGYTGEGHLLVQDGGLVSAVNGHVARYSSGFGTVVVEGANSAWTMSDTLAVAGDNSNAGGVGAVTVRTGGRINATNRIRVWTDGELHWDNGGSLTTGSVQLSEGGRMFMQSGTPAKVLGVASITIDTAFNSSLDLGNNAIALDYSGTSPLTTIRTYIVSGYASGAWTGAGINSSDAAANNSLGVGYAEATARFSSFPANFLGTTVDSSTVLVRTTYNGDTNLDGTVNLNDFANLTAAFNQSGNWINGDFNYDGTVGLADFASLTANFNQSLPGSLLPVLPGASVPEPTSIVGVTTLVGMCLVTRRRHERKNT